MLMFSSHLEKAHIWDILRTKMCVKLAHVMSAKPFSCTYAASNVNAKFLTSTLRNYVRKKMLNLSIVVHDHPGLARHNIVT